MSGHNKKERNPIMKPNLEPTHFNCCHAPKDMGHMNGCPKSPWREDETCHVCGTADTGEDPCACIICAECATKTRDDDIVVGEAPDEAMYCGYACAKKG